VTRGPQQQRLHDYLDGADPAGLRVAVGQWSEGQNLLLSISAQLDRMAQDMETSDDREFQGATAEAARASFLTSSQAMVLKAEQLRMGSEAFTISAAALDTANAERVALAQGDGAQPPERPNTPPGSTDPADVRAQRDYDTANAAYWEKYHADERRAADAISALDQSHTAAGEVFKAIHGEPDPVPPPTGGNAGTPGGGGTTPAVPDGGETDDPQVHVDTTTDEPDDVGDHHNDTDDPDGPDGPVEIPLPDPTGDPVPGDPTGPTGPVTPTTTGGSTVTTAGPGGLGTPAAGGGVAAGVGVGLAGGLVGGMAGGLASPGGVAAAGGVAQGGRGIGAGGPRGAGSPVLGRGNGIAGVGNGAGSGRGTGGRAARGGALAGSGRGASGSRSSGRGAAGSRSALSGAGAGRGSGRGKSPKARTEDHELFDDGRDWLDDEGAHDGVLD
jgi:hypothetical protein